MAQKNLKLSGNLINDKLYRSLVITPHNGLIQRKSFGQFTATGSQQSMAVGFSKYYLLTETKDPDGYFNSNLGYTVPNIQSWSNVGSGTSWTATPSITLTVAFTDSKYWATDLTITPNTVYRFTYKITAPNGLNFINLVSLNASNVLVETFSSLIADGNTYSGYFIPTSAAVKLAFIAESDGNIPPNETITINTFTLDSVYQSKYVTDKNAVLIFSTTLVSRDSSGIDYISIYRNGVNIWDSSTGYGGIGWVTGSLIVAQLVGRKGDYFEWYIHNSGGGAIQATINVQVDVAKIICGGDFVTPDLFLPSIECVDLMKFIFNYFGCSVYFNEFSKTLTANIVESIKTENSQDWSEYYLSHRSEYTVSQAAHNYMRLEANNQDDFIKHYNSTNTIEFGEGDIQTSNTLKSSFDFVNYPISAIHSGFSKNGYYLANVKLAEFENTGDPIAFSAITDLGSGVCKFTVADSSIFRTLENVLLINSAGTILGNIIVQVVDATHISGYFKFYGTDTGKIFKQKIKYNEIGFRILSVLPNTSITNNITSRQDSLVGGSHVFDVWLSNSPTLDYATFVKEKIGLNIDSWPANCALDNPTVQSSTFNDPSIKQLYFNKISKFFQNPNIRCRMILPESVYQSFDFSNFIYLKTEKLTGYFFVQSIVNYQNGYTPVEVNLYMYG